MTLKHYQVKLASGHTFAMRADLSDQKQPIQVNWTGEPDGWANTGYLTADARHYPDEAARLCARFFEESPEGLTIIRAE